MCSSPSRSAQRSPTRAVPICSSPFTRTPAAAAAPAGSRPTTSASRRCPRRGSRRARERHLAATLKDLTALVKAITQNSKIEESRDFAANVQRSVVRAARTRTLPPGPRRSPGALLRSARRQHAERPRRDRLRQSSQGRATPALGGLPRRDRPGAFSGMRGYLDALNANASRRLTFRESRVTVTSQGSRRR